MLDSFLVAKDVYKDFVQTIHPLSKYNFTSLGYLLLAPWLLLASYTTLVLVMILAQVTFTLLIVIAVPIVGLDTFTKYIDRRYQPGPKLASSLCQLGNKLALIRKCEG